MAVLHWKSAGAQWQNANHFGGRHTASALMSFGCEGVKLQAGLSSTIPLQQLFTVDNSIIEKT